MNTDTLAGSATDFHGKVKEGIGAALGDDSIRAEGKADQASGQAQQAFGDAKTAIEDTIRPLIDEARQFIKDRPFAAAAVGGVLGLALLNTLRGK